MIEQDRNSCLCWQWRENEEKGNLASGEYRRLMDILKQDRCGWLSNNYISSM
jgi:hypothetical protein